MCGISGIVNKYNEPVNSEEIKKITDLIIHRGPDSEGYFFGRNFALGNRRLRIIDLSERGHQPMTFQGKYTITFNGEIYNFLEIKQDLINLGYCFNSDSDTEVILAAYDSYGTNCVNLFNGMWAFALFDKVQNIIFCSRDRFGVKPFYYTELNDKFVFGSEIKQLLNYQVNRRVNIPILMDYIVVGNEDHTSDTFFYNIKKLDQSHSLIYNLANHTYSVFKYYDLVIDEKISQLNEHDSVERFKSVFYKSVALRLRSDVKVGTCLSGGLDSSSVSTIASSLYNLDKSRRFTAITAQSLEPLLDESKYAEKVVNKAGLDWHITVPTTTGFIEKIDKLVYTQEEPFGSPSVYMQYCVFEKAKELGCIVMLDGQGGDETLLGYERYYPSYLFSQGLWCGFMNLFVSAKNSRLSKKELLLYSLYFTNASLRLKILSKKFSFIKREYFDLINRDLIFASSRSYNDIVQLQKLELMQLQLPHLLKYEDRNSMQNSIESRLPFLDYHLVETALSINNQFKIKDGWTKYLLRKMVEDIVPYEIAWRKNKIGFNAPEKTWLTGINDTMLKQISDSQLLTKISKRESIHRNFERMDLRTKWRLYNVAKWEEVFNVSIS
jgi:asparagine synthase (glutamine-hydrolysing)